MSTPTLHTFVVYAPDNTEPGTSEKRLSVRSQHVVVAKALQSEGILSVAGWLGPEFLAPGPDQKMVGSLFIYRAESIEAVKQIVETDIYYTTGVWDKERIVISLFGSAFPLP
ncbi:hypothetical protein L208DRAFT_1391628 [Tricholoma matsutake]|nr:hypothetical protein L208DRAFT_1391628 [Tricholoma matsutake 945]